MRSPKTIVCLFDDSGNLFDDWISDGYEVCVVDILCPTAGETRGSIRRVHADLRASFKSPIPKDDIVFVSCHPPCDHLAVSGARWFRGKGLRALSEAISMFATAAEFCEWSGAPYMIENPVSTISSYWRKSDFGYHPWQYSGYCADDYYTKHTRLWTGGGFVMPETNYDEKRYARGLAQFNERKRLKNPLYPCPDYPDDRIHKLPPSEERAYLRSVTPKGFGRAVYLANRPLA